MTLFGNTPCKAILRISVTNADGSKLSFRDALLRNMRVYFSGYGLGIPLVQLVTFSFAYNKLKNKGKTSWDEKHNFIVSHGQIGGGRILTYCAVFLAFLFITTLEKELFNNEMKRWVNAEKEMALPSPAPEPTKKSQWEIVDEKPLTPAPATTSAQNSADYLHQGGSYYSNGRYQEALQSFSKAIEQDQRNYEAYDYMGWTLFAIGKYSDAVGYFTKAIELNLNHPSYDRPHKGLEMVREKLKQVYSMPAPLPATAKTFRTEREESTPKMQRWVDEKGNVHFSGATGEDQ